MSPAAEARRTAAVFTALIAVAAVAGVLFTAAVSAASPSGMDTVGLVDSSQGLWYLRDVDGDVKFFYYGNPGDAPFTGDWDCDGVDTPGLFRRSDGFVYLRNSSTQGIADIDYFFGNPGDVPIAGDFDGDGCDTVSIYRPGEGKFYIINKLGTGGAGVGAAEIDYFFGNIGDEPLAGDWDGDGVDTVGLFRDTTSLVYLRNSHTPGPADVKFIFGDPGDRHIAGDWDGDGVDSTGVFRPVLERFFLKNSNGFGPADAEFFFGRFDWLAVAGDFGDLEPSPTTTTTLPPDTPFSFPDGVYRVNVDIPAGTYRNVSSVNGCVWERSTAGGATIAEDSSLDIEIVTIEPTDGFFESFNCFRWESPVTPRRFITTEPFGDGTWLVPEEVAEGVWRSDEPAGTCEWELLSGFTGEAGDVIISDSTTGSASVLIDTDTFDDLVGFHSSGCEAWFLRTGQQTGR